MKKLKVFPKTFLYTLGLMLIIVLLSHVLIYFLMPKAYHHQKQKALETDISLLEQEITETVPEDRLSAVTSFAAGWKANISVCYEGLTYEVNLLGEESDTFDAPDAGKEDTIVIFSKDEHGSKISLAENVNGGADFFRVSQKFSDGKGYIQAVVSRQQIEEAVSAVLAILPLTAVICTVISALFAFFYSRMLTRPICQISSATEKMQRLEPEAHCMNETQDEIGALADNVNGLYHNLLTTIHELEREIRKVEEADQQKTNFLRAASHELKTPVTAVNAMLENMILGVGRYKDRDTYLARCKKLMEGLADMIRDILDTTRTQFSGGQELIKIDLADTLKGVAEPYEIIAKTKGIKFHMQLDESVVLQLPRGMIEKALSNIVANAVSYTREGGVISIYLGEGRIIIENECDAISPDHLSHIFEPFYRTDYGRSRATGGNGLGLYIVSSILKSLGIKYRFVPSEVLNGMSFQILF
ncbi:HAMP domain-containing sensor histidine kinase [Murimonas intestini]|uniref:HAMP domain-containing sensor histidine kinase n=1 Tax=Murimonas intestini TaxID=1337051 RepID=UPI0011DD5119|nr:HAMP domain-containing sensor histidine kinase [Murimonas intestini]